MSKWNKIRQEMIDKAVEDNTEVHRQNAVHGNIKCTIYFKSDVTRKAILLVPGFFQNRFTFDLLAKRLASYGYFCLSFDLPSHFQNTTSLSLGEISETITQGVLILRNIYKKSDIGVIAHSLGAVGAIYSSAGYNKDIESQLYNIWNDLRKKLELMAKSNSNEEKKEIEQAIDKHYSDLKQLIYISLTNGIKCNTGVSCYVMLAPPENVKNTIPGLKILGKLEKKTIKSIVEYLLHKPMVKQTQKDGIPGSLELNKNNPEAVHIQFFKTTEAHEFIEYFTSMKEPQDFLKLIEDIIKFRQHDDKVSFFEYYHKKFLSPKPKLFIYGNRDILLRPFLPFNRGRIEKFYNSWNNAIIKRVDLSHFFDEDPNKPRSSVVMQNAELTKFILKFLDKNL